MNDNKFAYQYQIILIILLSTKRWKLYLLYLVDGIYMYIIGTYSESR